MNDKIGLDDGAYGTVKGVLRLIGFFALILIFIPPQLYRILSKSGDLFLFARLFHKCLTRLLGVTINVHGVMSTQKPTLFVANHTSYLDIPVLGSLIPGAFVAKAEVASWPLFGFMARLQQTAFIERRAARAAEQRDTLSQRLMQGHSLILFPEGTSSDGQRTLPFKSSLFSIVEKNCHTPPVTVQPVSFLCTGLGGLPLGRVWRSYYAWYGDMTLLPHLWNVFKIGSFTVDVIFHAPVSIKAFANRKELALYCHQKVAKGVEQCITGRFQLSETVSLPSSAKKQLAPPT